MVNIKIEVGQIWEVKEDGFFATETCNCKKEKREVFIPLKKGSKIEIRFPFAWNYRTEKNNYHHSKEDYLHEKCKLVGVIHSNIGFGNRATLEEILRIGLYDKV